MQKDKPLPPNLFKGIRVFLVDDEDVLAWSIDTELRSLGAEVMRASSLREALQRFPSFRADLAICDLRLPDGNGIELLKKWRKDDPNLPVILITAHGAIDSAVTALRFGAHDYLQKPFDMQNLIAAVKRASEVSSLRQQVSQLQGKETTAGSEVNIIGRAPAMDQLREHLRRIAKSKADSALLLGESGTGKELAARAVHEWGPRAGEPFVEINCASIPDTLLESELFGYEKGAFTDARERKTGLFELARKGTVFLDEIGEMPAKLQAKLLRVLEYRRFKRLGGTKDVAFDGRIVAATHRILIEEVAAQRFRKDLFYRLNILPVRIPALRDRGEDIPELTQHFIDGLSRELEVKPPQVSQEALAKLKQHNWPGNVRELRNVLQRALIFYEPTELRPEHIEIETIPESVEPAAATPQLVHSASPLEAPGAPVSTATPAAPEAHSAANTGSNGSGASGHAVHNGGNEGTFELPTEGIDLASVEKSLLTQALDRARNNQTQAANLLGISRHTLRYRLEKHGLLGEVTPNATAQPGN